MWTVFIGILVWFASVLWPFFAGAPWVPMPIRMARRMLQLAEVQPGETVYDLGAGDGRVVIVAAREFGARAIGIEIDPLRALLSQLTLLVFGLKSRARIIRANLFEVNLQDADVVIIYLLPKAYERLVPKLRAELKPGVRVVTLTYPLPDWQPVLSEKAICLYHQS